MEPQEKMEEQAKPTAQGRQLPLEQEAVVGVGRQEEGAETAHC